MVMAKTMSFTMSLMTGWMVVIALTVTNSVVVECSVRHKHMAEKTQQSFPCSFE